MVDIGGESSRPGAAAVTVDEELRRIMPVFERLQGNIGIPVSVDTQHAEVARRALEQGASVINDITGCADPEMAEAAASFKAGVIIMHMQGEPGSMQNDPRYDNVVEDILSFFEKRAAQAVKRGVGEHSIMVDPGIGFGKTVAHNLEILHHISEFSALGFPVLVGASRKSFIGKTLGLDVHERLPADIAVTSFCSCRGADMVRVHDVMQNRAACNMIRLLVHPCEGEER